MHLYGVDKVLLREIAAGLSSVQGGMVDGLLILMASDLVSARPALSGGCLAFVHVCLTAKGQAWLTASSPV